MHKLTHILVWLALLAICPAGASPWHVEEVERVVAIADIHGAFGPMVAGLENAGVIDDAHSWSGGQTHLVIVGDILDRGPDSREAMDLLMRLEGEAEAAGGKLYVLIGNHEAMNLVGDMRYVSKGEYAAFAADESAEERERWFSAYAEQRAAPDMSEEAMRAVFAQEYPPGYFAHRRAFSYSGKYGKWLLSKPILLVIDGTAFVHGGLSPLVGDIGLEGVNERLHGELVEYMRQLEVLIAAGVLLPTDSFFKHPELLSEYMPPIDADIAVIEAVRRVKRLNRSAMHELEGPLWYRGNVMCGQLVESDKLARSLEAIGAHRVVVGHTPTPSRRVLERLDGRVVEIDTGMFNDYYGGQASALVIEDGDIAVITQNDTEPAKPLPHPREVGTRPGGALSVEDLETLLANGEIVASQEDEVGRAVVTVTDGTRTVEAFKLKSAGRGVHPDVAAYRLDRLLGLDMVPVAVRRGDRDADGSLQFLPKNWIDESQRALEGRGGAAWCPVPDQWKSFYVFDVLIYNLGRTGNNLLYSLDTWQLMLTGHGNAFHAKRGVPKHLEAVPTELTRAWRDALTSLSDDVLAEEFAGLLDKRRINALAARRDMLLSQ